MRARPSTLDEIAAADGEPPPPVGPIPEQWRQTRCEALRKPRRDPHTMRAQVISTGAFNQSGEHTGMLNKAVQPTGRKHSVFE